MRETGSLPLGGLLSLSPSLSLSLRPTPICAHFRPNTQPHGTRLKETIELRSRRVLFPHSYRDNGSWVSGRNVRCLPRPDTGGSLAQTPEAPHPGTPEAWALRQVVDTPSPLPFGRWLPRERTRWGPRRVPRSEAGLRMSCSPPCFRTKRKSCWRRVGSRWPCADRERLQRQQARSFAGRGGSPAPKAPQAGRQGRIQRVARHETRR